MIKLLMVQQNYTIGAIEENAAQIMNIIQKKQEHHDILVFSELALTGYPPEDWLYRENFQGRIKKALKKIQNSVKNSHVMIGHPLWINSRKNPEKQCCNTVSLFHQGQCMTSYAKQHLPNYGVFDEKRYFTPGDKACVIKIKAITFGILICEDLWQPGPWKQSVDAGAQCIIALNASPYKKNKLLNRQTAIKTRQSGEGAVPCVYVNTIGGQDELVFDGQSMIIDAEGEIIFLAKAFEPDCVSIEIIKNKAFARTLNFSTSEKPSDGGPSPFAGVLYQALVLATRDYVQKNHFNGVLIGLSGGIDSALTLAIAVDALGSEAVEAVLMPSRYTADMSLEDALEQCATLNVKSHTLSIEPIFESFLSTLSTTSSLEKNITRENLQARCRGVLLMALSNETGKMVLTTGNKSEMAMGYCTLYGDMCGGFAVLKDVLKTEVYGLARYRNTINTTPIIPQRVIDRPPSAELALNQKDQDSLPPYEILDEIIRQYMENNTEPEAIIASGIDSSIVHRVIHLLHQNEYKRRQSAPGPKVSECAFGKDWRYPITAKNFF